MVRLMDQLLHWWPLDDVGIWKDAHGGRNFTGYNSPTVSYLPPLGTVATFSSSSSQALYDASTDADPIFGSALTVCGWCNRGSPILVKRSYTLGSSYNLCGNFSNSFVTDANGYEALATSNTDNSRWKLLIGTISLVNGYKTMEVFDPIDGYTFASSSKPSFSFDSSIFRPYVVNAFYGATALPGGLTLFYDGSVGKIGIWTRALDDAEKWALYNNGYGMNYPLDAADGVNGAGGVPQRFWAVDGSPFRGN